jgi:hypothetical protein
MTVFADHFLAGALITLLIPGATFVAVSVWYTRTVLRLARSRRDNTGQATKPTPSSLQAEGEPPTAAP